MARFLALAVLVASLAVPTVALAGENGSDEATACVFTTQLTAEAAGTTSAAFGHTQIKVRNDGTIEAKTHIVNPNGEAFFAGHIHQAPAGSNGPIVLPLFGVAPANAVTDMIINLSTEAVNPALATAICANPQNYYVNFHTTQFPGGAIRGQLG